MRKRLFEVIELSRDDNKLSRIYDLAMLCIIIVSLIPLTFKNTNSLFMIMERVSTVIFIVDYILRFLTADYKMGNCSGKIKAFVLYPFTPLAIVDLLTIISSLGVIASGYRILKLFRLFRTLRVFRAFKIVRYSKSIVIISNVIKKQKESLLAVCVLAAAYIMICALIIFNVEPDTFDNFFSAIYWATVSLTTMGYGDIYPVSTIGRVVTMISSFVGIAIVALPAGIITAGYMDEINRQ